MKYLVVVERADDNYAAYSPDLPGCIATGEDRREALANMRDAIALHLEGMREDNVDIPVPEASADYVEVA